MHAGQIPPAAPGLTRGPEPHPNHPPDDKTASMLTGHDIIIISSIEWDFLWQPHQEIASLFAEAGNRVLYIENTGIRSPGLRDARRVALRLGRWLGAARSRGLRQVAANIHVLSPLVLPPFGSRASRLANRHILSRRVARAARRLGMREPILWTYLPTDTAVDLIERLRAPRSLVVYYCVADFAQLTPRASQLRRSEEALVRSSDLVFTNCSQLADHCRRWNDDLHVFPPGVNLKAFPVDCDGRVEGLVGGGAPSLTELPRPLIGYVGGLHRFVDYGLLAEMARARPHWSWVFVGPVTSAIGDLGELANVHLLGQRPHGELAGYIRGFDVCIVPYLVNAATATVVPVKVGEYLAMGKPVVSTTLPTVCEFNRRQGVLLTAANRPDDFLRAIEGALRSPDDPERVARRREVAALNDWQLTIGRMNALMESRMRRKSADLEAGARS
jgi:glycosyltransferase involved in cell wall biosynthesis